MSPLLVYMSNQTTDVELCGQKIPKQSVILVNNYSVNHSDGVNDHEHFRPERFLNSSGDIKKGKHYFPFGAGKRTCVGEFIAKRIGFVFAARLLQRFTISPPGGFEQISEVPDKAFAWRPKPFHVKVERNSNQ